MQAEIIESIGAGHDTLALMPTGGGKSLCFQVPAMAKEGLCLVVTPLIALMKDQVEHLRERDILAEAIYTGLTYREIQTILDNCQFGNRKFLYVSPERLESQEFLKRLVQLPVCMIAVDEAHCISQWGYDFRPSYLKIALIRKALPEVPVLALTATATPDVVDDIQERLAFKKRNVLQKSFERPNLHYVVRKTDDKPKQLLHILSRVPGSAIVYVRNRQKTKDIAELLIDAGVSATYYHAGLRNQEKDQRQQEWRSGEKRVMVATNAFGMGIDKADVRLVIHMDLPDTLEAYFQEAGRAGRDEKEAYAVLLYNATDKTKARKRVVDNYPDRDFIKKVYEAVGNWLEVGIGSGLDHTFVFPFEQFCIERKLPFLPTLSAILLLQQAGFLTYQEETETQPRVMILQQRDELYNLPLSEEQDRVLSYLLRTYTGIFANPVYINDNQMADRLSISPKHVNEILVSLAHEHIIQYIPRRKTPYIGYPLERQELQFVVIPDKIYENRRELYISKLQAMVEYAEQEQFCRSQLLLAYFGENDAQSCGQCDVCLRHKRENNSDA